MANINEEADTYQPKRTHNITELEAVDLTLEVYNEVDVEFPYKYVLVGDERYKVPLSVLEAIKQIRKVNPNVAKVKVTKAGEGKNTKYTVIPMA